jgi:Zn ribbon nucleic-acid-binding protein
MKSSMYLRKTIACPDCGQPNKVQFYVLDLVSEGTCEHCGHVVKFRHFHFGVNTIKRYFLYLSK